jgi:hypothetical protein
MPADKYAAERVNKVGRSLWNFNGRSTICDVDIGI